MTTIPPIVLGDDGTRGAVLDFALAEARRCHATLRIVHCAPMPAELLREESTTAQLLVVGIDDISWYDRILGGAVAGHLAAHASCPVVTVPPAAQRDDRRKGVVVALDSHTGARPLLTYAFDMAQERGTTLRALRAVRAVRAVSVGTVPEAVESARVQLSEVLAGWSQTYPDVHVEREVVVGEASDTCIAATRRDELVLVGRSGKHRTRRSTGAVVVPHARCPVAVVPLDAVHE